MATNVNQLPGKRIFLAHTKGQPRIAFIRLCRFAAIPGPVLLHIPARGHLRVDDPATFALDMMVRLDALLTGADGASAQWNFSIEEIMAILPKLGIDIELEYENAQEAQ